MDYEIKVEPIYLEDSDEEDGIEPDHWEIKKGNVHWSADTVQERDALIDELTNPKTLLEW